MISTLKEESSDESTIISSQTSTLTRDQGPEEMEGHADDTLKLGAKLEFEDEEEEDEEEEGDIEVENEEVGLDRFHVNNPVLEDRILEWIKF